MLNSVLYNNLVSFVAQDHHGTQAVLETTSGLLPFKWPFDGIPHAQTHQENHVQLVHYTFFVSFCLLTLLYIWLLVMYIHIHYVKLLRLSKISRFL